MTKASNSDRTERFRDEDFTALIFDCDGTLTDSMPLHFEAWNSTMHAYGIELGLERFYALGGIPTDRIVQQLSREQKISLDVKAVSNEKEDAFQRLIPRLEPINAVCDVVRRNHGKRPISVASGGTRELVTAQLVQIGLRDLFEILVCSEDTEKHKPEPDVFLEAARRMSVPPEKCCVFEDSPLGFEAALSAGMAFVDIRKWKSPIS